MGKKWGIKMSNCKHLKIKLNKQLECRLTGKYITWNQCKNCKLRELKINNSINAQYNVKKCKKNAKMHNILHKTVQNNSIGQKNDKIRSIKNKTSRIAKLERNRFSLFTNDLDHCILCGKKKDNLHEVFFGSNRLNSMKYGLVIPLCIKCHQEMHKNIIWQEEWHKKGQIVFTTNYPSLDFVEIFKRNYL